jgi:signal transduction histidine kinase
VTEDGLWTALRRSPLLAGLPDESLAELVEDSSTVELQPGDALILEGAAPEAMYVVLSGELEVLKSSGGSEVLVNVCGPGDLLGELGVVHGRPRSATVRARTAASVRRIGADSLEHMLSHPRVARALLAAITRRLDREELLLRQHERMAALGSLSAGLLHELNNPAAAVQRGAARLRELLVADGAVTPPDDPLGGLAGTAEVPADALARADAEEAVSEALAGCGVPRPWEHAAALVRLGVAPGALRAALARLPEADRAAAVTRTARAAELRRLLDEVTAGAEYLSRVVSGVRPLAYAADTALTEVDVHAGLQQALVLLRHKVPPRVDVVPDLSPSPQVIQGWPADLAMVWTNLIDNALAAVPEGGRVVVRTSGDDDTVVVDVENTGPPVPDEVLEHVFDPFFTTKPLGQGTGLGLATSQAVVVQRHHGRLTLENTESGTRARVVLPRRQ